MKQSASRKQMSPVNIDQNRAVGQDSFAEGSGMGRETNKAHGFPGEAEQKAHVAEAADAAESAKTPSREEAIRHAAYQAYQRRGGAPGSAADDWLEAEAEVDRQRGS
ncbi:MULTISPECIES: DUF2934 domain-containing protein [unclassified Variovorax]|uniref:DUF2934 domain-containing protein n=1 Tax=unclassified Variovorax TaxID=663243 RepID=UPI003F46F78C